MLRIKFWFIQSLVLTAITVLTVIPATAIAAPKKKSKAKPTPDRVIQAINRAKLQKRITPAEANRYRSYWLASGSAARRAPSAARRKEVQAVRSYTANLARSKQLNGANAARLHSAMLSVRATTYVMNSKKQKFPRHEQVVRIPKEKVVFKYYSNRGVQFQPFETFKLGMQHVNAPLGVGLDDARELADAMIKLAIPRGSSYTWEYFFPFGGPARPWTSSMSQALGTEFLHRTAQLLQQSTESIEDGVITTDMPSNIKSEIERINDAALRSARALMRTPKNGGVAVKQGSGHWFLMYPFAPNQRILNGHLQVLVNVARYAEETNHSIAKRIVNSGVKSVIPMMYRFSTGGWSRYQLGQEANLNYHEFQTSQLKKLGAMKFLDKNEVFKTWYERFDANMKTAPVVIEHEKAWGSIIPVKDGYKDTTTIRYSTDKRSKDRVRIRDAENKLIRLIDTGGGAGEHSIIWNALDKNGKTVPPGEYSVSVEVTDILGNKDEYELEQTAKVEADETPPVLQRVTLRKYQGNKTRVQVRAFDTGSGYIDLTIRRGKMVYIKHRAKRVGTTTLIVNKPLGAVQKAQIDLRDSSGNVTTAPLTN